MKGIFDMPKEIFRYQLNVGNRVLEMDMSKRRLKCVRRNKRSEMGRD